MTGIETFGTWAVGILPDGSVPMTTPEGPVLWDGEDGTAPRPLDGLPERVGEPLRVPGTSAVAMLEHVGDDGYERPGFFEDGMWTSCDGPSINMLHTYMLLEDPSRSGIVYTEADYDLSNNGTIYVCTTDGVVTELPHPTATLRVLGDALNPGDW